MSAPLSILGASARAWVATPAHRAIEEEFEALWAGQFRKIGRFIKLALSGAALAMRHAGLTRLPSRRTGVFLGTGLGNLADLIPFVHSLYDSESIPSPIQFANSVGNSGAFYIAQAYALEGPVLAICQDEVSFEVALMNAAALLRADEIDYAVVGGIDVFVPPVSEQLARLGREDESIPLGEGAGFWLLSREAGKGFAQLLEVSVKHAAPAEELKRCALKFEGAARTLFLADGLRERQPQLLASLEHATLAPSAPGIFPAQTAFGAGAFVTGTSGQGGLYHSLSSTREGLLGAITARKTL